MNQQIKIDTRPQLQTLYGMSESNKKILVAVGAGLVVGVAGFLIVKKLKRRSK